jgi:hypothetical protein
MNRLPIERRQLIVADVRRIMEREHPAYIERRCLDWSRMLLKRLRAESGVRAVIQAGSFSWPIVPEDLDDGVSPTHFSYVWEPESTVSRQRFRDGLIPEMHIWVGLPETQEIVDLTTCFLPELVVQAGLKWRTPAPPPFLWVTQDELPERVLYKPDKLAIALALHFAKQIDGAASATIVKIS